MFKTMKLIEFQTVYHQQLSAYNNVTVTRLKAKNSFQGYCYEEEWHSTQLWPRSPISATAELLLALRVTWRNYTSRYLLTQLHCRKKCMCKIFSYTVELFKLKHLQSAFGYSHRILPNFRVTCWLRYCSDVAQQRSTKLCTMFGCFLGWYIMYTLLAALITDN